MEKERETLKEVGHKRATLEEYEGVIGKVCSKCRQWKPLYEFSKDKSSSTGVRSQCKLCIKTYREKNKEYAVEYRRKNADQLSIYFKDRYRDKKEEIKEKHQKYRKENHEKILDQMRRYRNENKEKISRKRKQYYDANKEEIRRKTREYQLSNPGVKRLSNLKRRAQKLSLPNDLTFENRTIIFKQFNGCALTGINNDLHWDHVIPLSTGHGGTTYGNMVPLISTLNLSKNESNIFEWFEANRQRFELSQERFDKLIAWLASANAMTVEEYRDYVYWCHANPRKVDESNAI